MAIYHLHLKPISAGAGQSAVAAAAYRHATEMRSEETGEVYNYQRKSNVVYAEVILPEGCADWARDAFGTDNADKNSERLWNALENKVTHKFGRYAQEIEVALPKELKLDKQLCLIREFCQTFTDANRVVDFAIHDEPGNIHAHILITARKLTQAGWSPAEIPILDHDGNPKYRGSGSKRRVLSEPVTGRPVHLRAWRKSWADLVNGYLEEAGFSERVDHRSFANRGIELLPTQKRGPAVDRALKEGIKSDRLLDRAQRQAINFQLLDANPAAILPILRDLGDTVKLDQIDELLERYVGNNEGRQTLLAGVLNLPEIVKVREAYKTLPAVYSVHDEVGLRRLADLQANPEIVLNEVQDKKATFTEGDLRRAFQSKGMTLGQASACSKKLLQTSDLVCLGEGANVKESGRRVSLHFCTAAFQTLEKLGCENTRELSFKRTHKVEDQKIVAAIQSGIKGQGKIAYSIEQKRAIAHLLEPSSLGMLVGLAGTGKSTLLYAANKAWTQSGYQVRGTAIAAKAADELYQSSEIPGQTLYSLLASIRRGKAELTPKDIIVVDEAGMVGSDDMYELVRAINSAGAKLVLVGDPDQLQPIGAGKPFADILKLISPGARVEEIRRQKSSRHRAASQHAAAGQMTQALGVYEAEGAVRRSRTREKAIEDIASALAHDISSGIEALGLAHRREDVDDVNKAVRRIRLANGDIEQGLIVGDGSITKEVSVGEHILYRKNDDEIGVTNGTLGVVTSIAQTSIKAVIQTDSGPREVVFDPRTYTAFDYAYAVTIHKAQGITLDKARLFVSPTMSRNLAYVGMTRHRSELTVHYDGSKFPNGIAKVMSRKEEKTSTLDYPLKLQEQIEFGERHGIDTYGFFEKVAMSIMRFIKGIATQIEHVVKAVPENDYETEAEISALATSRVHEAEQQEQSQQEYQHIPEQIVSGEPPQRPALILGSGSIKPESVNWCIEPQTEFKEKVECVAERVVKGEQYYRQSRNSIEARLAKIFDVPETGKIMSRLAREITSDRAGYQDYVAEVCREASRTYEEQVAPNQGIQKKGNAKDHGRLDDDVRKRQELAERSADTLSKMMLKWQRATTRKYDRTFCALRHERTLLRQGLEYPAGQLGKLLHQEMVSSSGDNFAFEKIEALWTDNEAVLTETRTFLDKWQVLSRAADEVRDGTYKRMKEPTPTRLERAAERRRLTLSSRKKQKKSMSM